jgi:putative heme transporter
MPEMSDRVRMDRTATAPIEDPNAEPTHHDEEMPRVQITRERMLLAGLFVASAVAFLYFVLPQITGLGRTWDRINRGDPAWLVLAAVLEACSFGGYVVLFRTVFVRGETLIDWRESYEITMSGVAATRLFAAAGAGGVVLTAWALRRSGMDRRLVACRMVAFLVLLYAVFMAAVIIDGIGLRTGLFPGPAPFALTLVPAIIAASMVVIFLAVSLVPTDFERRLARWASGARRLWLVRWAKRLATVPASTASGVRTAISLVRAREPGVLGAVAWWAFDIAVLWASFNAFGHAPPTAVIVLAYFIGQLGNLLPLPGGVGGVEGGLIGALIAFDVNTGLAVVSVLVYRGFNFWLPTIPGAIAYLQLRRTVHRWKDERRGATVEA